MQNPEGTVPHVLQGNRTKADEELHHYIFSEALLRGFALLCLLPRHQIPIPTLLKDEGLRHYLLHPEEPFAACAMC